MFKLNIKLTKKNNLWHIDVPTLDLEGVGYPDYEETVDFASDLIAEHLKDLDPQEIAELVEKDEAYFEAHPDDVTRVDIDVEAYKKKIEKTASRFSGEVAKEPDPEKELEQKLETEPKTIKTPEGVLGVLMQKKALAGVLAGVVLLCLVVLFINISGSSKDDTVAPSEGPNVTSDSYEQSYGDYDNNDQMVNSNDVKKIRDGYTVLKGDDGKYNISYGIEIENVSNGITDDAIKTIVVGRDSKGEIIGARNDEFVITIPKGGKIGIGGYAYGFDKKPDKVEIDISYDPYLSLQNNRTLLEVAQAKVDKQDEFSWYFVGDVVNDSGKDLSAGVGYVLYKDSSGDIVGGNTFYFEPVRSGKNAFSGFVPAEEVVSDDFDIYAVGYDW